MEKTIKRNKLIDICKGIGIISIVIGHASWNIPIGNIDIPIGPFVYLYHLAIFFFCSGFLYKKEENDWGEFLKKKIKALYFPFVIYSVSFLLFRNFFINLGILAGEKTTIGSFVISMTNILTFNSLGEFLSAFWFLPVMFITMLLYTAIFMYTRKLKDLYSDIVRFCICLVIGFVGVVITEKQYGLLYNMQISYLMVFVVELGHFYKKYEAYIKKYLGILSTIICGFLLAMVLHMNIGIVELSKFMVINRYIFYPVTIIGIAFCISLSSVIDKSEKIGNIFAYIGKNSFDIMALHFLAFKIVDLVACFLVHDFTNLSVFPHTFIVLWPVYYIVGIGLPLVLKKMYTCVKAFLNKKLMGRVK